MNKNIKLFINYGLGPLLFLVLSWSLYRQIIRQPDLPDRWEQVKDSWHYASFWIVLMLMFFNWGIETVKWQLQLSPLEKPGFGLAFRSVLAGCSITMLTPNRIGEYAGRVMFVQEENRLKAIPLTILGSISQLTITMLAGTVGLIYLRYNSTAVQQLPEMPWFLHPGFLALSVAASVILLLLYFKVHLFVTVMGRIQILQGLVKYISVADSFSRKQLLRMLFLSAIRYMVFILQYVLILQVMAVGIPEGLSALLMTQFFLIMVLAPTIGFTELPVRATAGVAILSMFSDNVLGIQAAMFAVWLINLVLPAIIGSLFILGVKMMKTT